MTIAVRSQRAALCHTRKSGKLDNTLNGRWQLIVFMISRFNSLTISGNVQHFKQRNFNILTLTLTLILTLILFRAKYATSRIFESAWGMQVCLDCSSMILSGFLRFIASGCFIIHRIKMRGREAYGATASQFHTQWAETSAASSSIILAFIIIRLTEICRVQLQPFLAH